MADRRLSNELNMSPKHTPTALNTSTSYDSDYDDDSGITHEDEPWFFRLFNRAAAFGSVIAEQPSATEDKSDGDKADVVELLGRDLATMAIHDAPKPTRKETPGREEQPKPGRVETPAISRTSSWRTGAPEILVNLSASSWLKRRRRSAGLAGSSGSESDEEAEQVHDDLTEMAERRNGVRPDIIREEHQFTEEPETITPSPAVSVPSTPTSESPPLTSQEKVNLIIAEFGALADTEHGEEERMLAESDATFFQDVAILGVLHLTTHRLTFHASLLSARPDLEPAKHVLHAGPAVIRRRKGLMRRKRVWMELTRDMITTFRSSEEHERVRPLRTILLSAFRKIQPIDPRRPRVIVFEFSSAGAPNPPPARSPRLSRRASWAPGHRKNNVHDKSNGNEGDTEGVVTDEVEYDTNEAALAWRREVQAALYMYRHRRRAVLSPEAEDGVDDGVRINIPLARIASHRTQVWANIGTILQIGLGTSAGSTDGAIVNLLGSGWTSPGPCTAGGLLKQDPTAKPDSTAAGCSVKMQFALLQGDRAWKRVEALIVHAKAQPPLPDQPGVVVNFGALTFVEKGLNGFVGGRNGHSEAEVAKDSREKEVRRVFGLGDDVDLWIIKCSLNRAISTSGLLVTSARFVCFWSRLLAASDVKLRFYTADVRSAVPAKMWCRGHGLTLQVRGHEEILLEFSTKAARDDAIRHINRLISDSLVRSDSLSSDVTPPSATPSSTTSFDSPAALLSPMSRAVAHLRTRTFPPALLPHLAKPINVPDNIPHGIAPRHFVCLTIGSRGDVQPYIALGRGLLAAGHRVTIVTHEEYRDWIEGWGIGHRTAGGDPGALMKLSVEHKMFSPQFFKESIGHFRTWIDELLVDSWEQCKDADVLIESPSAMAGVHIAEALNIPYFRAFTMPWSKTAQYPHPFISPPVENSKFNIASYVLFDNVFWLGTSGQINRWRKKHLGLEATDMGHMAQAKITFLYNFSPSVVPKPLDWGDQITISGYWFLDNPDLGWTPAPALLQFIAQARKDGKPLVYIGFGSITVPHARAMTRSIVKAVLKSDVRAILSKGWSSRMAKEEGPEVELPASIYAIDKAPHDWLFPQMDAALHHGGAGTTGASLRAGIPTLIKPWFGDQFFWASRVQRLGAGLRVASLRSADLAEALKKATSDRLMQEKAAAVGERIRQEDGVPTAIQAIYMYLDRAGRDRTTLK